MAQNLRLVAVVTAMLLPPAAWAQTPVYCDTAARPKEKAIDARFMALPYLMMSQALAEKLCGARPKPLRERIVGIIAGEGCGPTTPIYRELERSALRIENADLRELVTDGSDEDRLSNQQVRDAASSMANELGGCRKLIEWHRKLKRVPEAR